MSGPKSSRYTLTAAQLKKIMEEQEQIRREFEKKAKMERERKEAFEYLDNIKTKAVSHSDMIKKHEQSIAAIETAVLGDIPVQYQELYAKLKQLQSICDSKTDLSYETLMEKRRSAEQFFEDIVDTEESLFSKTDAVLLEQRIYEDSIIANNMQLSFASIGKFEKTEDILMIATDRQLDDLLLMELSYELQNEVNAAKSHLEEIEDKNALQNFIAITIEPLKKRCIASAKFIKDNKEKFFSMLDRYHALCIQLEEIEENFEFSENGMARLTEIISLLERRCLREAEQIYISQSVDEVMKEMGYEVIGHRQVQKKSGKKFKSKLLTYDDGTVVNVTETSTGQITMEIGGIDDRDRLPDANERVALQKSMVAFCRDFKEIESRLSEKGVILDTRISMVPPEETYAQIINFTDYELSADYKISDLKKKNICQSGKKKLVGDDL